MAQKLAIFPLLFLLVVFQVSFLPGIFPQNSAPSILLVMLVFWTARKGIEKTWKLAILGGLLSDLFLFVPVGVNIFSFLVVIILVNYLAKRFFVTHQTWRIAILFVLIAAGALANELALALIAKILFVFQKISISIQPFIEWKILAYKIINSLVVFAVLYWPFKKTEAIFNLYGSRTDPKSNVR